MISEQSALAYCSEDISKIENYEQAKNDTTQTWHIHHKAEILPCGNFSVDDLIKHHLYYQRPAIELVFLTPAQHNKIHNSQGGRGRKMGIKNKGKQSWLGKHHTKEAKKKMSNSHRGAMPWNKGKAGVYSDEVKDKMGAPKRGKPLSQQHKHKLSQTTRAANLRADISGRFTGLKYWNNGIVNKRARECPEGFWRGRLKYN